MSGQRVIYSADDITARIEEISTRIVNDYGDEEIVLVGILKGAAFFLADLARLCPKPLDFEFVDVKRTDEERQKAVDGVL